MAWYRGLRSKEGKTFRRRSHTLETGNLFSKESGARGVTVEEWGSRRLEGGGMAGAG